MERLSLLAKTCLGKTPLHRVEKYCPSGAIYLKLEMHNPLKSIKDRAAYFIVKDLLENGRLRTGIQLVESSSGNLGLALGYYCSLVGVPFTCLVDPTVPKDKIQELKTAGVNVQVVELGDNPDYRTARIRIAQELDDGPDWISAIPATAERQHGWRV